MGIDQESIIYFTPMFCARPSRKGMVRRCNIENTLFHHQNRVIGSLKRDVPASPQVSCMGHIRSEKGSNLSGTKGSRSSFFQFKKIFARNRVGCAEMNGDYAVTISSTVEVLDPPLPVAKGVIEGRGDEGSLWTRRCGYQLEGLQLQRHQSI